MKDDLISRQAATTIPVMPKEHRYYQTNNLDDAYEQGWNDLQECIENLPPIQQNHNADYGKMVGNTISRQAAIDALDCINGVEEVLRSLPSVQPDVPDTNIGDMISKQAAIDILATMQGLCTSKAALIQNSKIWQQIKDLPSVQSRRGKWMPNSQFYPEVNTHWIRWECSECGYTRTKGWEGTTDGRCPEAKICENCGADMTGNDDGTD